MKNEQLKLRYALLLSLFSLFSCENGFLNESTQGTEIQKTSDVIGQQKAIAALNQFRDEINPTNTRSLSDLRIRSIKSETYQIQISPENVNTRSGKSNVDSVDIYTIVFDKDDKTGFSILSPDERVGRMYAYTEEGSINDTLTNKALAVHLNGIKEICKADLMMYYTQGENKAAARSTRGVMYPNFLNFEWGEKEPFNALCPKLCGGKPALAGGVAVSAAEIIMHYKKKLYDKPGGGGGMYSLNNPKSENAQLNSNTRTVNTNYNYKLLKDYPRITNSSPTEVKSEAARLIYDLANLVGSRWGCGVGYGDDTCADLNVADAIFGPFLGLYFKDRYPERNSILEYFESNISTIDKQKIITNIAMNNPIIVQGMYSTFPSRHVWIYTGVKYSGTSTIDELYINWGAGGSSNGWYAFNNNLGYFAYEVLFVDTINPDGKPGGGTLQ